MSTHDLLGKRQTRGTILIASRMTAPMVVEVPNPIALSQASEAGNLSTPTPDIYTVGKWDILPEAKWALAFGKLSQQLLPVLPALPSCHYIWLPYWADFFLANLMLFLAAVFHNKFQVRNLKKKKTQRGNLLLPTAQKRLSGVNNFYQCSRVRPASGSAKMICSHARVTSPKS